MTDFKRDGDYVVEGTDIKAEYFGKDHNGHLHFLVDGVVCWMGDSGQVHGPDHIEGKRIIERPKTRALYFAVYVNHSSSVWAMGFASNDLREGDIKAVTAIYGVRCIARFEKTITEGEGL